METEVIEKEALQLPDYQRALLADRLLQSITPLSDELEGAWVLESDARFAAYQEGRLAAVDGPQAMAELSREYRK